MSGVRQISKKEYKSIIKILNKFGVECSIVKPKSILGIKIKKGELIVVNNIPLLIRYKDYIVPHLKSLSYFSGLKKIVVDMGAINSILNGADVMRPGIVSWDENIVINDIVAVCIEKHGTPIAIGISLVSGNNISKINKGRVVKNLHHLKDKYWEYDNLN